MYHHFLVASQFVLAAIVILTANWWPLRWSVLLLSCPGVLLGVWAFLEIGLSKVRIHPSTTESTQLTRSGPYRIVRHPMYTSLLWIAAILVITPFVWWRIAIWFALCGVLLAKTSEEEKSLRARFCEYAAYQRQVGKMLPKLIVKKAASND